MGRPAVRLISPFSLSAQRLNFAPSQLDSAAYLIAATELPLTPQELLDKMDAQLLEAFKTVEILPGVLKLVHHLKAHNVPMAVSTVTIA